MPQLHTWQPLSMCRQNSVRGRPENSLHHAEWLPGVQLRHFSPTCAVHVEDCGGWWLSGCRSSVAEHWLHKPGVRQNSVRGRPENSLHHAEWLPGVQLRHFSPTCAVHIEDCGGWWLSGCRSSVAEHWLHKPGVLGSIPGGCRPFHFPLFAPHNI